MTGGGSAGGFERAVQLASAVVAPVTLFTALLYYFGWVRTNSLFQQFGVEAPVLRLSVQDYVLRSVEGLYVPVGAILVVAVLGMWGHGIVTRLVGDGRATAALTHVAAEVAIGGAVLFLVGVGGVVAPAAYRTYLLLAPSCLALGTLLCAWSRWLWHRLDRAAGPADAAGAAPVSGVVAAVLAGLVVVLSLFWVASDYAAAVGRGLAADMAAHMDRRPQVVVFSAQRLFLVGPGVQEQLLPAEPDAAYHYRYEGLRLLIQSSGQFVLLPAGWTRDDGPAYVLDEGDGLRFEFRPGDRG